jgi:hypothetical protein
MAQCGQRKCLCCGEFFFPDPRSAGRQRYCSAPECRCASKAASQAAWLAKPQNLDYFKGPLHVERVRAWRAAHPGYSRPRPPKRRVLQDPLPAQVLDFVEQIADRAAPPEIPGEPALQDLLSASKALLAGLIAHLFELTLQDEIATTTRRLVQRGQDLIGGGGGDEGVQTRAAAGAAAPGARAVQLG